MRLILPASAALASAALVAPVSLAGSAPSRLAETRPAVLWKAFPLDVAPTPATAAPSSRALTPPVRSFTPPVVVVRTPDSSGTSPFVAAGIAVILLGAAGAAFLVLRGPARRWDRAVAAAVSRGRSGGLVGRFFASRHPEQSYVLLLPGRGGWGDRIVERLGQTPSLGEVIYDDELGRAGQAYVVKVVGRSPLPGDRRLCAVLRSL
jgi:hypothetical protein